MADAQVGVVITAQDNASATISKINSSIKGLEPAFKTAAIAGGAAFAAISAAIVTSVDAANEAAGVQAQLGAVLKSTKGAAGETADAAIALSKALESTTTFSDETVLSAENMLLTFTSIGKDVFPQATSTVLDMAQALGEDTKDAAIQLGKALQDPVLGVTALRRVGVSFNDDQINLIKTMVASGNQMEAQKYILAELGKEFGGSAAAAAATYAGKLEQAKNQLNDMQEEIGNALIPVLIQFLNAVTPIITKLTAWITLHPQLTAGLLGLAAATTGLITVVGILGIALSSLAGVATALGISVIALLGWMVLIPLAIAAVIAIGYELYAHWGEISAFAEQVWGEITAAVSNAVASVVGFVDRMVADVMGAWTSFTTALSSAWAATWNAISTVVTDVVAFIVGAIILGLNALIPNWEADLQSLFSIATTIFTAISDFISATWSAAVQKVSDVITAATTFVKTQFTILQTAITAVLTAISGAWNTVWGGISSYFSGIWKSITDTLQTAVDFIQTQVNRIMSLVNSVTGAAKSIGSGIGGAVSSVVNTGKSALGVNDGVIQNGQIISTNPDDFIIATKTPQSLGGGSGVTVSINGGFFLDQNSARAIGDEIIKVLGMQFKY